MKHNIKKIISLLFLFSYIFQEVLAEEDCRIQINAGTIAEYDKKTVNGIQYDIVFQNGEEIFVRTSDPNFRTAENLSIDSRIYECFAVSPELFVEKGTCIFIKLSNEWNACVSVDLSTINFSNKILFFFRQKKTNVQTYQQFCKELSESIICDDVIGEDGVWIMNKTIDSNTKK